MKIFISWSGSKSKYIATSLSNWIEQVLQAAEPWISTDIDKGKRWSNEIASKLEDSKVAIICLTNSNLESKWIHFEAGAIAKTKDAHICTFLFDVIPTDVQQPLSQFQATKNNKEDIYKLVKTINTLIGKNGGKSLKDSNLEGVFDTFWPQLEKMLKKVPDQDETPQVTRTEKDLLEESLQILRGLKNSINTSFLNESDQNEIIDFWIEKYAKNKNVSHDAFSLTGHEELCAKYMSQVPEIKKFFGTGDLLISKIKERIDQLLPF